MNPIGVSRMERDLFPLEGAPKGLLFEPEIMTLAEETVFLNTIKKLPFGAFRRRCRSQAAGCPLWYSLCVWFGGDSARVRFSDLSRAFTRAGRRNRRCSDVHFIGIPGNGIRTRSGNRLALRFPILRYRSGHLLRRRLPTALPTWGKATTRNLEPRSSAAIPLCVERHCEGGMAA